MLRRAAGEQGKDGGRAAETYPLNHFFHNAFLVLDWNWLKSNDCVVRRV
jgi:hypothetical protein